MKVILSGLTILAIMHGCVGAQWKKSKHVKDGEDQEILNVYYSTSPFREGHEERMRQELPGLAIPRDDRKKLMELMTRVLTLITKKCEKWKKITGYSQETTDKLLAYIYSATKTGEPDHEGRMYRKFVTDLELDSIDPEIVRSVVHNWYRQHVKTELHSITPQQRSTIDRRILKIYHETEPFRWGHEKRMSDKLKKEEPENKELHLMKLKKRVTHLFKQILKQWEHITGWDRKETNNVLFEIYLTTKNNGANREAEMCEKLLKYHPNFDRLDPEMIRTVVHDWYKRHIREELIQSKNQQADLIYVYDQVKYGNGSIFDRLAEKWERFHPELKKYTKKYLFSKAYHLYRDHSTFSSEEMEEARKRYETVFGAGSGKPFKSKDMKRTRWTRKQNVDVVYLYNAYHRGESLKEDFDHYWRLMHPELATLSRAHLVGQVTTLIKRNFTFNPGEEAEAHMRLKVALAQDEESNQDATLAAQGELPSSGNFHGQELHQQLSDWIMHSSPGHDNHDLTAEDWRYLQRLFNIDESNHPTTSQSKVPQHELSMRSPGGSTAWQSFNGQEHHQQSSNWLSHSSSLPNSLQLTQGKQNDLEKWLNSGTIQQQPNPRYSPASFNFNSYSPIAFSPFPGETSHSHFGSYSHYPHNANPYHEHGSSSHSHYDPQTTNPNYKHGGSSHSHHDPHTSNSYYEQGSSSHSHDKPEP